MARAQLLFVYGSFLTVNNQFVAGAVGIAPSHSLKRKIPLDLDFCRLKTSVGYSVFSYLFACAETSERKIKQNSVSVSVSLFLLLFSTFSHTKTKNQKPKKDSDAAFVCDTRLLTVCASSSPAAATSKMSDVLKRKNAPKRKSQVSSRSKTRNQESHGEASSSATSSSVMQELINKATALGKLNPFYMHTGRNINARVDSV